MAHQKRGFSRRSKTRGNKQWQALLMNEIDLLASVVSLVLVDGELFKPFNSGKVTGVRGWLTIAPANTGAALDTFAALLTKQDDDIGATSAAFDPFVAATYVDEDIYMTWGSTINAAGVEGEQLGVQINTSRNLTVNEVLRFVFSNNLGTGSIAMSGVMRASIDLVN